MYHHVFLAYSPVHEKSRVEVEEEVSEERSDLYEIEELNVPTVDYGTTTKATVTKIVMGKLGALVDVNAIKNPTVRERMMRDINKTYVEIRFRIGETEYRELFKYSLNPRSKLVKYTKKYGAPKVGQEIEVRFNDRGFPKIVVE